MRNAGDIDNRISRTMACPKSAEIWFNELRLTDFNNKGGWAANARTQITPGRSGNPVRRRKLLQNPDSAALNRKWMHRNKEETNQVDISTNLELGKLLP
ncbi:MAG: hypothetical protein MZV63_13180 [Marinilabiliales bacterium]|nr:hypothetical protein [Marinilabiliales bacterium]